MTGICVTVAAVLGSVVLGQAPRATTAPAIPKNGIQVATSEPAYSNTKRVPDELLEGTRRKVIILPREPGEIGETGVPNDEGQRTGGVVAKIAPEQHRLPEGYVIGSRVGRIDRDGNWFVVRVKSKEGMPDAPPLRILPNRELAKVEAILGDVPDSREFLLTGRLTEFQGSNYLLLEHVAEAPSQPAAEEPVKAQPAKVAPNGAEGKGATSPDKEPTPEEIIRQLMKNEPERALVLPPSRAASKPAASGPAGAKAEPAAQDQTGWPEGTFLVDQLGRVVPGGEGWWSLAWEDRGELAGRKPVRMLPNRLLETAIALSGGGTHGVVFIVSGEVTEYKGVNYLLVRKVLVRRELGNFR